MILVVGLEKAVTWRCPSCKQLNVISVQMSPEVVDLVRQLTEDQAEPTTPDHLVRLFADPRIQLDLPTNVQCAGCGQKYLSISTSHPQFEDVFDKLNVWEDQPAQKPEERQETTNKSPKAKRNPTTKEFLFNLLIVVGVILSVIYADKMVRAIISYIFN